MKEEGGKEVRRSRNNDNSRSNNKVAGLLLLL